jgi:hypothetical protein
MRLRSKESLRDNSHARARYDAEREPDHNGTAGKDSNRTRHAHRTVLGSTASRAVSDGPHEGCSDHCDPSDEEEGLKSEK